MTTGKWIHPGKILQHAEADLWADSSEQLASILFAVNERAEESARVADGPLIERLPGDESSIKALREWIGSAPAEFRPGHESPLRRRRR